MFGSMTCSRCGSHDLISPETTHAWDEITCHDCGEFIDTRQGLESRQSPSPLIEACLKTRAVARQMGIHA
ncbi:hypothetical protein [Halomonas sp. WWR20]